ncbi:hypothetical protein PISMIDRAFT_682825, partial [Pisolithus microcarpus 441]
YNLSYVPLVTLSASLHRLPHLISIADSLIYVVSRMGTTESSVKRFVSSELLDIIARNLEHVPLAVVFGVATCLHFDAVVVGSHTVSLTPGRSCSSSGREGLEGPSSSDSSTVGIQSLQYHYPVIAGLSRPTGMTLLPPRFGQFGGQYIPEARFDYFIELEEAHNAMRNDLTF